MANNEALEFTHGGSPGAPITVRSFPGERASIENRQNSSLFQLVYVPNTSNYITLTDLSFIGPIGGIGMKIVGDYVTVSNSEITNLGGVGNEAGYTCVLLGSGSAGPAIGVQLLSNKIHGCGSATFRPCCNVGGNEDHGVYVANGRNAVIRNNILYDIQSYAIQLYPQAMETLVESNTIDAGPASIRGGTVIGGETGLPLVSSDNTITNNVVSYAVTYEVTRSSTIPGTNNVVHDNCAWPAPGAYAFDSSGGFIEWNNLIVNPLFVDRSAHNYTLRPGSPCTGKGAH